METDSLTKRHHDEMMGLPKGKEHIYIGAINECIRIAARDLRSGLRSTSQVAEMLENSIAVSVRIANE